MVNTLVATCLTGLSSAYGVPQTDRTVLPLGVRTTGGETGLTHEDAMPYRIEPTRPPAGAPNVVIALLDDVGFGAASTFGGLIDTPNLDKLAAEGLRYNCFHTTALCSPSRAALLTGRNHHAVGTGTIIELATGYDGYNSIIPKSAATIAEVLNGNGYSTAAYGKWHNTPLWETSADGPFDRWPTGLGFNEFYGFMAGETNQYYPSLYHGTTPIERPRRAKHYQLTTDLADHAIEWIGEQETLAPGKPYFIYFAPGATHAPHHVYRSWWEPYRGKFNQGWDKLRQQIFERQKKLGVIPADAKLTPRPAAIPAWASLSPARKQFAARLMEIYAGYLAYADHQIGRLIRVIKRSGEWKNTLFMYIVGDNGAAAAGGVFGHLNEMMSLNGLSHPSAAEALSQIEQLGTAKASNEYPVGFGWAMNTPFQWTKQFASHFGGTRNPMVITWPERIHDRGGLRSQFHHLIDIAPTIYEAARIPAPHVVDGVAQMPLAGISMAYTFDHPHAKSRRTTQYFEIMGRRGIYHDGWMASTYHSDVLWQPSPLPPFDKDRWELYHVEKDFTQSYDLARERPEKLQELKELFLIEAARNEVFPLDDRGAARLRDGVPASILGERRSLTLREGDIVPEDVIRATLNRSHVITARLAVPKPGDAEGVLVAAGGYPAGFSLYVKQGRPMFTYNYFGAKYTTVTGQGKLSAGQAIVRYEFAYDGGGRGKGGVARLFVNDRLVDEERLTATVPAAFTASETFDTGLDSGTPAGLYESPFFFNGDLETVTIDLK
jgi:arylsulfatase